MKSLTEPQAGGEKMTRRTARTGSTPSPRPGFFKHFSMAACQSLLWMKRATIPTRVIAPGNALYRAGREPGLPWTEIPMFVRIGLVVVAIALLALLSLGIGLGTGFVRITPQGLVWGRTEKAQVASTNSNEVSADDMLKQKGIPYVPPQDMPAAPAPGDRAHGCLGRRSAQAEGRYVCRPAGKRRHLPDNGLTSRRKATAPSASPPGTSGRSLTPRGTSGRLPTVLMIRARSTTMATSRSAKPDFPSFSAMSGRRSPHGTAAFPRQIHRPAPFCGKPGGKVTGPKQHVFEIRVQDGPPGSRRLPCEPAACAKS